VETNNLISPPRSTTDRVLTICNFIYKSSKKRTCIVICLLLFKTTYIQHVLRLYHSIILLIFILHLEPIRICITQNMKTLSLYTFRIEVFIVYTYTFFEKIVNRIWSFCRDPKNYYPRDF